jgi:DNA repair exonuclease SbcCD ATPase subunit
VEEPQRNQFLERNRVAASKCRQKKKEWAHDLEDTKSMLEAQNMELHSEYDELLEQVTNMKNSLLCHATCNDPIIDGWIELEARKYVEKSLKQRRRQSQGHFDGFDNNNEGTSHQFCD